MNKKPLVSVIIITYNRALLLQKAIQSVLDQTSQNFEIIVVNNSSTDNTVEVVQSFNDKKLRLVNIRNDGLLAKSRNLGMKMSKGAYIAFLDDDDLWLPEKLEKQVDYLCKHPEYHLVYSNAWVINENGVRERLFLKSKSFKKGDIFEELLESPFMPLPTILMKREVFETIGFLKEDPSILSAEDYDYWLRVALRYKIGFMYEPLAMYRIHPQMMSKNRNWGEIETNVLSPLLDNPLIPNKKKIVKRIQDLHYKLAIFNWRNSNESAAKEDLKKYLRYSFQRTHLLNILKGLSLWLLLNFDYYTLRKFFHRLKGIQKTDRRIKDEKICKITAGPLVSVIIPTYNRADYLKLALKSVLEQTYKNIEVIVIDDGSTDNTKEVVESFNDSRIEYFYQENTGTPAVGRNVGMKMSKGAYIAFLDDDDLWLPEKLEKQVDYLCKYPEYHLVYSKAWVIDENGLRKRLLGKSKHFKEGEIFEELVKDNCMPQPTILMEKEVFENTGFFNEDPPLSAIADYDYWLRAALRYKIGFVDEPLALYRIHPKMISKNRNWGELETNVLSSLLNNPLVTGKSNIVKRIQDLHYKLAIFNWRNSNESAAKEDLKKYLRYSLRRTHLLNILRGLSLLILLNFDYNSLRKCSHKLKGIQTTLRH